VHAPESVAEIRKFYNITHITSNCLQGLQDQVHVHSALGLQSMVQIYKYYILEQVGLEVL